MFFIFGSPRSGTTLLAATLDQHDEIVVPPETDFIVPLAFIFDRVKAETIGKQLIAQLIVSTEAFPHSLAHFLSKEEVEDVIRNSHYLPGELIVNLYERIAAKAGKKIAGDKSPNDLFFVRMIIKTGMLDSENIKIIQIVRDIRDVILSLQKTNWAPPQIETYFPRFWNSSNLYLHESYKHRSDQYLLIKYEEMVKNPASVFRDISTFLGVPFQETMLEHSDRGLRYRDMQDHQKVSETFLPERAGAWQRGMSLELQKICERQAREALEIFGYL